MIKNYLKVAWRQLRKNTIFSLVNIIGLSAGIAVSLLIGLWIHDELSYDRYNKNYDRIAQVMQNLEINNNISTWSGMPYPLAAELRKSYASNFKYVVLSSGTYDQVLSSSAKSITKNGAFMESAAPEMLDLTMIRGNRLALRDPSAILISKSTALAFFGNTDPTGKMMRIDSRLNAKVAGVYDDLPNNSSFSGM